MSTLSSSRRLDPQSGSASPVPYPRPGAAWALGLAPRCPSTESRDPRDPSPEETSGDDRPSGVEVGATIELRTGAIAAGGGCVARTSDGRVVFVRHSLPGELVGAEVTSVTNSFLRADAVEVLEASPDRVVPACAHAGPGRCGGCDYQ